MNILGISCGHEANAAIFVDNRLVAAVAEERFTRLKMEMGYPKKAVDYCIRAGRIGSEELDCIVLVSENDPPDQYIVDRISTFSVDDFVMEQNEYWKPRFFEGKDTDYMSVFRDKISMRALDLSIFLNNNKMSLHERVEVYNEMKKEAITNQLGIDKSKIRTIIHEKAHIYIWFICKPYERKNAGFYK